MRKAQKKQAEDFLKVLDEAHSQIRTTIENKKFSEALGLLGDCQQGAISLGGMIEASEGEDFVTIPFLERYCELVYQLHEGIIQGDEVNGGKAYKLLRSFLLKIENSIKNDIKVRIEAVFLPYKASMWDSLESVWKAADEDPDCDAYVIPIPYYDKNPDGTFREMHYEGSEYPDYVPVTWYGDYDFEKRRPDMIFIHNPYDNYNYVTSVHPDFYSDRLKQFTDKLIYIPYFILNEINPNDKAAVDKMSHFCTCPGVLNADKVVVQSEDMRQVYINVLTEYTKAYGYTRRDWENRILGLGSPKVDKVLNTRKEDLDIPKEWLKVIEKPDGSWKKIVFYNTSVSALLQYDEKMLGKMKDVFRVFEENKEEVALLWRPHPLIPATIESMRPQLWEGYERLVEEYKEAGWGIYDDSADVDRAVVVSDGYYGDWSSIVTLCQRADKMVMIQDVDIVNGEKIFVTQSSMPPYEEYIEAIKPLWESHRLTNMGVYHQELESQLKEYLDVPELSLMVNGHMALELTIQMMDFPKGGEVITTPFTFISTTHAIIRNGLNPVFCDVKMSDGTIDETKIEDLITEKTVAILPVHVYGNICNVEEIQRIANKYSLKVIYDAAHAFGVRYKGKGIGNYGDVSIFSFHATKVFNTIEGGAVTFSEKRYYGKLYNLKNFGIRGEELVTEVGANAKMNEFCAIMGICNLKHIGNAILRRKLLYEDYKRQLKNIRGIRLFDEKPNVERNYGYFPVLIEDEYLMSRDELYEILKKNGIYTRKYFYPLTSDQACFKNKYRIVKLINARELAKRVLVLPIYEKMNTEEMYNIIELIKNN